MERNIEAYSKAKASVPQEIRDSKKGYDSITPEPIICYPAKASSGIKRSPEEVRNNKSNDEIHEDVVESLFHTNWQNCRGT